MIFICREVSFKEKKPLLLLFSLYPDGSFRAPSFVGVATCTWAVVRTCFACDRWSTCMWHVINIHMRVWRNSAFLKLYFKNLFIYFYSVCLTQTFTLNFTKRFMNAAQCRPNKKLDSCRQVANTWFRIFFSSFRVTLFVFWTSSELSVSAK